MGETRAMRSMLYLLAISAGLGLAAGPAAADPAPASIERATENTRGGSLAAGDYEPDEYDPKKHHADRRNIGNRPVWWWTHPMCRPKLRQLGNCKLELDKPAPDTEPEQREQSGR